MFVFSKSHFTPLVLHTRQRGATLIELMIGIAVGLLTVAVAIAALMATRGASGTISDASQLQQQSSYAFRVLGQQLRQAGSLRLNLAPQKAAADPIEISDPVAFETKTPDFNPATDTISGKDNPSSGEFNFVSSFRNYEEATFPSGSFVSLFRDCLGQEDSAKPTLIQSRFFLDAGDSELECNGQPVVRNVADFQVRYLVQANAGTSLPTIQYLSAAAVGTQWQRVFGVEVCLVLYGDESISMPDGSAYAGCDGTNVNMSSNGLLSSARKNKMHMAFRNVFQLRSQGLAGLTG